MADVVTFVGSTDIRQAGRPIGVRHEISWVADASSPSNDQEVDFPASGIVGNIRVLHDGVEPTTATSVDLYDGNLAAANRTELLSGAMTTGGQDDSLAFKSDGKPLDYAIHEILTVAVGATANNSVNSAAATIYVYVYFLLR